MSKLWGDEEEKKAADDILDAIARFLLEMGAKNSATDMNKWLKEWSKRSIIPGIENGSLLCLRSETGRVSNPGQKKYSDEELRLAMELERVE